MQGCVISCGTVVFFQKSRNLSRSLLTNDNFYCAQAKYDLRFLFRYYHFSAKEKRPVCSNCWLLFLEELQIFTFQYAANISVQKRTFICQGFLLTPQWTMVYIYTSFGYHTFLHTISKNFLAIKDINKPLLHAKFQTDWFETAENGSD